VTSINLYDADGDALIWYLNTDGRLVSAKAASIVTVDSNGVISFTDQTIFYNKNTAKSVVAVNLRDNVKVSGTSINWDGQIKHFDSSKGEDTDIGFATTGFQFGTYNGSGYTIQYFYFPTSTETTVKRMFQNTPIKVADFEPGTSLKKLGLVTFYQAKQLQSIYIPNDLEVISSVSEAGMFQHCTSLSSVTFEENSRLWDAGHNTFYGCSSLKELYLPNSVITFGSEFARGSGIETFSFGASFQYITRRDSSKDPDSSHIWVFYSARLKTVYMPATFAILGDAYDFDDYVSKDERLDTFDRIFNNAGKFTLFFTGTKEEIETLKTRMSYTEANQSMMTSLNTIYSYDEYVAAGSPTGSCAVYGYSACTAFYNGEHKTKEEYVFAGFISESHSLNKCDRCTYEQKGEAFEPIITFLGYSIRQTGGAVTVGYALNNESIDAYEANIGAFNYGVVAYIPEQGTTCNPLVASENEIEAVDKQYTIFANLQGDYASVDFVIRGFPQEATSLAMCMYIYDGKSIVYICGTTPESDKGPSDVEQLDSAYVVSIDTLNNTVTKA
jgi:hypothetical protein